MCGNGSEKRLGRAGVRRGVCRGRAVVYKHNCLTQLRLKPTRIDQLQQRSNQSYTVLDANEVTAIGYLHVPGAQSNINA